MKAGSPDGFESKVVVATAEQLVHRTLVDDEKVVYIRRFEPVSWDEGAEYHEAGASAYELYVICSDKGKIEEVNHRGEPCPCSPRSIIPHGAPAHIFPPGAMFDVEWDDIASCAQAKMLQLLERLVGEDGDEPAQPTRSREDATRKRCGASTRGRRAKR